MYVQWKQESIKYKKGKTRISLSVREDSEEDNARKSYPICVKKRRFAWCQDMGLGMVGQEIVKLNIGNYI